VTIEPQAAGFWPDQAGTRVVFATPPNGIWVVSLP
jgi:hypothetical protein